MDHTTDYRPSFVLLTVSLDEGESLQSEAGAMVSYSGGTDIETNAKGGLFGSLKRSVLGGKSFSQDAFSTRQAGEVSFAPPLPGDIVRHGLEDETLYVRSGSYIASDPTLGLDTSFGGAKTFFGSEGLFLLELTGTSDDFLSNYGAIHEVELGEDERYAVDTGYIVAFDETTSFSVERVDGLKSTLFSDGGLVCAFTGPGTVWIQSRSIDSLLSRLIPKLPISSSTQPRPGSYIVTSKSTEDPA